MVDLSDRVALVAGATRGAGRGIAVAADHLVPAQVAALVARIERESGRLDVLVNDIWGGEQLFAWDTPLWGTTWTTVSGCCGWPSTPTWSPATPRCRC